MQEAQAAAMSEQQSTITQSTQSTKPTTNDVDMKDLTVYIYNNYYFM